MEDQKLEKVFKTVPRYEEVEQKELRKVMLGRKMQRPGRTSYYIFDITAGEPILPIKAYGSFNNWRWAVDSADKVWMGFYSGDCELKISSPERLLRIVESVKEESSHYEMKDVVKIQSALGYEPTFGPCPCCGKWGVIEDMKRG